MLKAAYDICVNQTAKVKFSYINTVLEKWYKNGYKKLSDIPEKEEKKKSTTKSTSYSIEKIKRKVNNFD